MGFCLLLKIWANILVKSNNLSGKCSHTFFHHSKQSATDGRKPASKREIQKPAEATGDLIGNKIANKIKN